jgi:drug/metabolite transporter (DMT)-like permease
MLAANLGMLLVALSWGTMIPSMTHLLMGWDPFFLAAARYCLPIAPMLLLLRVAEGRQPWFAGMAAWRWWLLGTVGIGMFAPLYTVGIQHSNPVTAAILSASSPVVTAFVGWIAYRLPVPRHMIPGILMTIAGCTYATYDPSLPGTPFDLRGGELFIIASQACWSWYSITAQRWLLGCSQIRITTMTTVTASVTLITVYLVASFFGAGHFPPAVPPTTFDYGLFIWLALVPVMIGNILWHYGVNKLGAVIAALFMNLMPITAILITAAMGIAPTRQQLIGGAFVLAGIMLAQLRRRQLQPR